MLLIPTTRVGAAGARLHVEAGYDPAYLELDWNDQVAAEVRRALRAADVIVATIAGELPHVTSVNEVLDGRWTITVVPYTPRVRNVINAALLRTGSNAALEM